MKTVPAEVERSEELSALGEAIRSLRKGRGISQEELSFLCGIDRSHMGRIERGERNVSFTNLLRIARGLSCLPSEILLSAGL